MNSGHQDDRPSQFDQKKRCLNCDRALSKAWTYCADCGQKTETRDVTAETLVQQGAHLLHFSIRTVTTLYEIVARPSKTIENYLNGKRQTYTSPVAIFSFGYGVLLICIQWLNKSFDFYPPGVISGLNPLLIIGSVIAIAIFSHHWLVKPKRTLPETIVVFMYIYGAGFLFATIVIFCAQWFRVGISQLSHCNGIFLIDGTIAGYLTWQLYRASKFMKIKFKKFLAPIGFSIFTLFLVDQIIALNADSVACVLPTLKKLIY